MPKQQHRRRSRIDLAVGRLLAALIAASMSMAALSIIRDNSNCTMMVVTPSALD